jgi:hypothetical protein
MAFDEPDTIPDPDEGRDRTGEALAGLADDDVDHTWPRGAEVSGLADDATDQYSSDGRVNEAMAGIRRIDDL